MNAPLSPRSQERTLSPASLNPALSTGKNAQGLKPSYTTSAASSCAKDFYANLRRKHPYACEKLFHSAISLTAPPALFAGVLAIGAIAGSGGLLAIPLFFVAAVGVGSALKANSGYQNIQKHSKLTERNYFPRNWYYGQIYDSWDDSFTKAREEEQRLKQSNSSNQNKVNGFEVACRHTTEPKEKWSRNWLISEAPIAQTPLNFLLDRAAYVVKNTFQLENSADDRCQHFHTPEAQERILQSAVGIMQSMIMQKLMAYMPEDMRKELETAQNAAMKEAQEGGLHPTQIQQAGHQAFQDAIGKRYPELKPETLMAELKKRLGLQDDKDTLADDNEAEKDKKKPEDLGFGALGEIDPNAGGGTIGTDVEDHSPGLSPHP